MIRLFRVSIPSSVLALVISETLLLTCCFLAAAYWSAEYSFDLYFAEEGSIGAIIFAVLVIQTGLYLSDLYDNLRQHATTLYLQQLCLILGAALLLQSMLSYVHSRLVLSKWVMLPAAALILIALPLWRKLFHTLMARQLGFEKVLFLQGAPIVEEIIAQLRRKPEFGLMVLGYLDGTRCAALEQLETPYLGTVASLDETVRKLDPDRIVVGDFERDTLPLDRLLELRFSGIHIEEAAVTYETLFGRVSTEDLRTAQLIFSTEMGPRRSSIQLQALYAIPISIVGLVLTSPIMAVVALLVKLTSPGPVLYRQIRSGRNNKPFHLYKFRSMYINAEAQSGPVWATKDDPRITPVGRWLRRLRLDELPQFFNVLRGDMSIVGPRPERPEFVKVLEEKIPLYRQRLCVKPGITGWAQINHKYGDTMEDTLIKLEFDLYYIKNMTPALDLYIIFHTAKVMLLSRGAQ